jgi:hypothetical protein
MVDLISDKKSQSNPFFIYLAYQNVLVHVTDWLPTFWGLESLQGRLKQNNPITTKSSMDLISGLQYPRRNSRKGKGFY